MKVLIRRSGKIGALLALSSFPIPAIIVELMFNIIHKIGFFVVNNIHY